MNRKERPKCRENINHLLKTENVTLEQLAGVPPYTAGSGQYIFMSEGMRTQARKMLEEQRRKEEAEK